MYNSLISKAQELRRQTFRAFVEQGEAHLGGSFSIIEMLLTLYEKVLGEEDKFILSKAHASFPLCLLLQNKGLQPELRTHLELDPVNGIHCTTGSLGHGLPIATGMAMARKRLGRPGRIYVMISDGECQEGTTWESLLIGAKHELDNLVLLVDYNKIQSHSFVSEVMGLEPVVDKWASFGFAVQEVNGHDVSELDKILSQLPFDKEKPTALICHTIKGKGFPFAENNPTWHHKSKLSNAEIQKMYDSV